MTYEELMADLASVDRLAEAAGISLEDVDRPVVVAARRVAGLFGNFDQWCRLVDVFDYYGKQGMSEQALMRYFFGVQGKAAADQVTRIALDAGMDD